MFLRRIGILTILVLLFIFVVVQCTNSDASDEKMDPLSQSSYAISNMLNAVTERLEALKTEVTYYGASFKNFTKNLPSIPTWMSRTTHSADEM